MRPSPERLELQVRSLANAQDTMKETILEERNIAMETSKQMVDTVTKMLEGKLKEMVECTQRITADIKGLSADLTHVKTSQVSSVGFSMYSKSIYNILCSESIYNILCSESIYNIVGY